ncbi:carbohydrate ABC transporter permease [Paenibacillus macerans]|uniref:Binding--dependent transport system inner membrane component family protein n=1 Tax=Paenibacillus macerans TaxID=44252 RepID=A0A091A720_PAEMA|nr:carbohydrate ABC transporter permease [Paenibacillus macerans]KFN12031.1 binding--dependent transport system inner membrane component family protein [Paenibacillus macerans]MCY7559310.1 carbohydrate ABC transporter permease [Paenibacillus macerans]MEC0150501.1 carbohydrate ABC transporter permease [Paenibacillus macerans]SUD25110.1 binding-protein-dependent transport systems inner membrane component [Paenibacillus macerans]GIP13510.1 sugar ABC transporter ATP-binding protein [Paenibacillus 
MMTSRRIEWPRAVLALLMFAASILFLLPFFWMLMTSFKIETEVFVYPIEWIPRTWNAVENYKEVWFGDYPFYVYYWNSIKVAVATTFISSLISSLAAYGFSKIKFAASQGLFLIVLATYMIPSQAILVPQFILYRNIGLFDSHLGLIVISSFSVLGTFMLRQFFMGVHQDFIESAKIDGAGHLRIFRSIGLPLVKPAVATYAILRFIWTWNDYQNPLIFLRTDKWFTLPLAMQKFTSMSGEFYSLIMAGAVSAIFPLLIIFIIGQKSVIEGIALGGVKG